MVRKSASWSVLASLMVVSAAAWGQGFGGRGGAPRPEFIPEDYNDHRNMMEQLGIRALRPGPSGNTQFSEEKADQYKDTMPELMKMKDGTPVTRADQWPKRRAEILEDFEREIYGRIPANVPKVTWEVTATTQGTSGNIPTISRTLVGRVDNSAFPQITVNIQASFTVPANATGPVPIILEFGGGFGGGLGGARGGAGGRGPATAPAAGAARGNAPATMPGGRGAGGLARGGTGGPGGPGGAGRGPGGGGTPWTQQAIAKGWGYGYINPGSIQADSGGNNLRQGIIGLTNKGQPRKPEDWGSLRAWGWGVGRLIDYFEANPDVKVDPRKVGIEGVSRYGKAALVTAAFDERVAVAFVASSGEGGAKLHRRIFGEQVENLAGSGEYHWMAGNFLKYAAADATFGSKTAADLPIDSHQLIALCAPRLCLISYGVKPGDPDWVDARGSFMAGILAGPAYKLLGKQDFGVTTSYLSEPLPAVGQLVGGELAWRQHEGGHTSVPNFPAFFEWAGKYIPAPALPPVPAAAPAAGGN